jgi:hypothetical protein
MAGNTDGPLQERKLFLTVAKAAAFAMVVLNHYFTC